MLDKTTDITFAGSHTTASFRTHIPFLHSLGRIHGYRQYRITRLPLQLEVPLDVRDYSKDLRKQFLQLIRQIAFLPLNNPAGRA